MPETVVGETSVYSDFDSSATEIEINSVKSFPDEYGLLKINDEIITYTGITSTSSGRGKVLLDVFVVSVALLGTT